MATKSELLQQAEIIRTQTEENGNTAELVGSILKLIINYAADADSAEVTARNNAIEEAIEEALSQTIPSESVIGGTLAMTPSASGITFSYNALTKAGSNVQRSFTVPVLTTSLAGVMTPAQMAELRESIQQSATSLLTEIQQRTQADATLQLNIDREVSAREAAISQVRSVISNEVGLIDQEIQTITEDIEQTRNDLQRKIDNQKPFVILLDNSHTRSLENLNGVYSTANDRLMLCDAVYAARLQERPIYYALDEAEGVDGEMMPVSIFGVNLDSIEFAVLAPSGDIYTVSLDLTVEDYFSVSNVSQTIATAIESLRSSLASLQTTVSEQEPYIFQLPVALGRFDGTTVDGVLIQKARDAAYAVSRGKAVFVEDSVGKMMPATFVLDNEGTVSMTILDPYNGVWLVSFETMVATSEVSCDSLHNILTSIVDTEQQRAQVAEGALATQIQELRESLGSLSSVGNIYNVSNEVPPVGGFYSLVNTDNETLSAVHVAKAKGKLSIGLVVTFAISATTWKTYQFIGPTTDDRYWLDASYWNDFGSLAAGTEAVVVLNVLLGSTSTTYTLSSAIDALATHEANSGVLYRKTGLILSYRISETEFEAKQFCGQITDFTDLSQWKDFGGGGTVETSDEPEVDGTKAFSTGGAAHFIPSSATFERNEETGTLNMHFFASDDEEQEGEPLFSLENIPMGGSGGGGGTGATINFTFAEGTTRYGAAGRSFQLALDIDTEDEIDAITVSNNATKAELVKVVNPRATGAYYIVDVSSLFSVAGSLKLAVKVEAGSLSLTKTITLTAVDVTIQSVQTLNYTSDTVLRVGGGTNSINLYKFPNNVGTIDATIEIYVNDEWRVLAQETVTNTATKALAISPKDVFGDGSFAMSHGSYPIRIHGVDHNSGVVGNYLYTSVLCLETGNDTPLIALQWLSDEESMTRKLLETISINYAVYDPTNTITGAASFYVTSSRTGTRTLIANVTPNRANTYTLTQRVENVTPTDGTVTLTYEAVSGNHAFPYPLVATISGALVDIEETSGVCLDIDLTGRSNSDADKSIVSSFENAEGQIETYELSVTGANYRTNGFVKDSYGTPAYGTANDTGRMALRIAEDITATLNYPFFANANVERNGSLLQFQFMTKNIANEDAVIMKCYDGRVGFYIDGKCIIFTTVGADPVAAANKVSTSIRANYTPGKVVTVGLVMERADVSPKSGVALVRLFVDGEECGVCQYNTNQSASYSEATFTFDGTNADLYLYGIKAWRTFSGDYIDAFHNYLLQLSDTSSMIEEYNWNNAIMQSQAITQEPTDIPNEKVHVETGTKVRPQATALYESGMAYFVFCSNADEIANGLTYADQRDGGNFPSWLDSRTSDKKSVIYADLHAFFPERPWQNFIAEHTPVTNQGTTSSGRPIKNIKSKMKKARSMRLMYTREEISAMYNGDAEVLAKYDKAAALIAKHKIQILENSVPTNIVTVKVDFSDPGGANNGAFMEMYNNLQRAMGENYMTPMQVAYTGPYIQNTSIDSIPIAMFRTDTANPSNAYFHAKANWNQDKGDPEVFGFENSPGYNDKCINYGEFKEVVVTTDEDAINDDTLLATRAAAYVAEHYAEMDASELYMFSEFCGEHYRFYRDSKSGHFIEVDSVEDYTDYDGTLAQLNAAVGDMDYEEFGVTYRIVTGGNFKFYHYQSAGFQDTTGRFYWNSVTNAWTTTGDALNPVQCYELLTYVNMAWMRGVSQPSDMTNYEAGGSMTHWMKYFESRYPDDDDLNALYEENKKVPYQLYRLLEFCNRCDYETGNVTLFKTDGYKYLNPYSLMLYHLATDYDMAVDQRSKNMMIGFCLEKSNIMRAYFNFAYDGDCLWTYDNDCGQTVPLDMDPNSAADETYYAGYGSILFKDTIRNGGFIVDDNGTFVSIGSVLSAAREAQDMNGVIPFSPAGHEYYWITKRLKKWPKLVSSYDGERKYVNTMAYDSTYLFSLHGLGLHFLSAAFEKRFKLRDGYYGGPSFLSDVALFRGLPNSAQDGIRFEVTAAEPGYFTIGVEGTDESRRMTPVHLDADETHTFVTGITMGSADGSAMYVLGASNIAKIDVSSSTWRTMDFSNFTLLKELIIGGENYVENQLLNSILSSLVLGSMPYLEIVNIVNTSIRSIDLSGCPRLTTLLAEGSDLTQASLAEGSRISTLSIPDSMEVLTALSLPNLLYTGLDASAGIMVSHWTALTRLIVENCNGINMQSLMNDIINSQSATHRIARMRIIADLVSDADAMLELLDWGVQGIDVNGNNQAKPYFEGTLTLSVIREVTEIEVLRNGYEGLTVITGLQAYINRIREVNGEDGTDIETGLPDITLENIDELALLYYNGESSDEWIADYAEQNS